MKTNSIFLENPALVAFMVKNSDNENKNTYIMNAQGTVLIDMIKSFLGEIDNFIQLAADAGKEDLADSLSDDYHKIQMFYTMSKLNKTMRLSHRNEVRLIMKETYQKILN